MNKLKTHSKLLLKKLFSDIDAAIKVVMYMFFVGVGFGLGFSLSALYVLISYLSAAQKVVG